MLILDYQRLFLISLFLSGQSDHPLLAIYASGVMSKPLHPHIKLLYYIYIFLSIKILQFTPGTNGKFMSYNTIGDLYE